MKIKLIGIGIAVLFLAAAVVTVNIQTKKIDRLNTENARLEHNNLFLMADINQNGTLYLKEKEINSKLLAERDSLSEALKIRPKQILKIVTNTLTERDTVRVPVYVQSVSVDTWELSDTGKCFIYDADLYLENNKMEVWRSNFEYNNKTTEVNYYKRPFNFWFIHLGKKKYFREITPTCGESITKEINFIK